MGTEFWRCPLHNNVNIFNATEHYLVVKLIKNLCIFYYNKTKKKDKWILLFKWDFRLL